MLMAAPQNAGPFYLKRRCTASLPRTPATARTEPAEVPY